VLQYVQKETPPHSGVTATTFGEVIAFAQKLVEKIFKRLASLQK